MRKKLLCLVFAAAIVFSFAACGNDDTQDTAKSDFDSFMEVQKNMENVKDTEFKMDMDMNIAGGDAEAVATKMSASGKEILKSKDDIQMEMNYNIEIPSLSEQMGALKGTMYMKDQALYMEMMGQKLKMDASDEIASMMNFDTSQMLDITEDMISDLKVSQEGSDTVYDFNLDANKALEYFQKNAGAAQTTASLDDVTFKEMKVSVTAGEDKMVKSMDMDCTMDMAVSETGSASDSESASETSTVSYTMTVEYLSINTDLKIDFPDFSDYQELTV